MAGGLEVADVFRRHGPAFRAARRAHLDRDQRRAMGAIEACRKRGVPDARVPPFASAMAWKAAWCSRTPSSVTQSRSLS